MSEDQWLKLVALIMVLFLVAPGFLYYTRQGGSKAALRNVAIWTIIALVAGIVFSLFGEKFDNF
jgi:lysylphosphatidylglycerol synthetase-like protein (DUF2156 family)